MKLSVVSSALLICVLASSGGSPAFGASRVQTLVQLHPNLDIDSLDPAWANDTLSRTVISNVYEPLVSLKGSSLVGFEPRLSEEVPSRANGLLSADGRTYRFPIRKDVRFHDGSALACEDARYSLLRFALLDRPTGGPSFHLLRPLVGALRTRDESGHLRIDVEDLERRVACRGSSLVVTLPKPYAPFLQVMAQYGVVVSKRWAIERGHWDGTAAGLSRFRDPNKEDSPFFSQANGTGPFELMKWDKATRSVRLRRNESYWRRLAELEAVVLNEVPELSVRRMMISAGDAHISEEPGAQHEAQWRSLADAAALDVSTPRTDAFFFAADAMGAGNPNLFSGRLDGAGIPSDFFSDQDIRLGFAYAFDDERYLHEALNGRGRAGSSFLPQELSGQGSARPFDLEKARTHFERAWGGAAWTKGFRLAVAYNAGNAVRMAACQILKRNVESLNPKFRVEIRALDWASYLAAMRQRRLPLFLIGYTAAHGDADGFASAFLHSEGLYLKLQGFKIEAWDKLVDAAAAERDPAARGAIYRRLEEAASDFAPQIYLARPTALKVVRNEFVAPAQNPVAPGTDFYAIRRAPAPGVN